MCQSGGKTAVSNDRWSAGESAQFFKIILGIWSGPETLWGLMALNNLHTLAALMLVSLVIGCCGGSRMVDEQLVKTLWNWSRRISAFSLLSHTIKPFCLGGGYSNVLFSVFNVFLEGF